MPGPTGNNWRRACQPGGIGYRNSSILLMIKVLEGGGSSGRRAQCRSPEMRKPPGLRRGLCSAAVVQVKGPSKGRLRRMRVAGELQRDRLYRAVSDGGRLWGLRSSRYKGEM